MGSSKKSTNARSPRLLIIYSCKLGPACCIIRPCIQGVRMTCYAKTRTPLRVPGSSQFGKWYQYCGHISAATMIVETCFGQVSRAHNHHASAVCSNSTSRNNHLCLLQDYYPRGVSPDTRYKCIAEDNNTWMLFDPTVNQQNAQRILKVWHPLVMNFPQIRQRLLSLYCTFYRASKIAGKDSIYHELAKNDILLWKAWLQYQLVCCA